MAIAEETPEYRKKLERELLLVYAWMVLGFIASIIHFIMIWPLGPALGPSQSPERWLHFAINTYLFNLPIWFWCVQIVRVHPEWIARDMGVPYENGKIYPLWTPKRLVTIAMGIALFGFSGVVPATTFDFPQFAAQIMMILYGPIEGCFCLIGHGFIRMPLFSGLLDPFKMIPLAIWPGGWSGFLSWIYHRYLRDWEWKKKMTVGLFLYVLIGNFTHVGCPIGIHLGWPMVFIQNGPWAVQMAQVAFYCSYWVPFAWVPNIALGYIICSVLLKYKR